MWVERPLPVSLQFSPASGGGRCWAPAFGWWREDEAVWTVAPGTLSSTTLSLTVSSLLLASVCLPLGSVSSSGAGHQGRGGGRPSYRENLPTDQLFKQCISWRPYPHCHSANVMIDGKSVNLGIWAIVGQEDFDRLYPLSYLQTGVLSVCFFLVTSASLENVRVKCCLEVWYHCPSLLSSYGAKLDCRNDKANDWETEENKLMMVTYLKGLATTKEIQAV